MDYAIDALIIILKMILVIAVIDAGLLYLVWRIKVINRNVDRRMKKKTLWDKEQDATPLMTDEEMDRFYGAPW